jgi:hypothetical protein
VREQPTKAVTRGYWANLAHTLGGSLNDEYLSAMETLASLFTLPLSEFVAISSKVRLCLLVSSECVFIWSISPDHRFDRGELAVVFSQYIHRLS